MRWLVDDNGRSWRAERVGRTSGIMPRKGSKAQFPEPVDIVRFTCDSDQNEPDREVTSRAGLLEQMSDDELKNLLQIAPKAPGC